MKKILFSLLMLCCMTAAWAGTGEGSREKPYSGEWQASGLVPQLKVGDCLAYDCVIQKGIITVYDSKHDNRQIASQWLNWAVGDVIDESPTTDYTQYCACNSLEERKSQVFIITAVSRSSTTRVDITGYFSGEYFSGDGSQEKPYAKEWSLTELVIAGIKPGDYLANNFALKNVSITVEDDKLDREVVTAGSSWTVSDAIDDTPWPLYTYYCRKNAIEERAQHTFIVTKVETAEGNITLTGHYPGDYGSTRLGYVDVNNFNELKQAVDIDNAARIQLMADIYLSDGADAALCNTFSGTIDGRGHTVYGGHDHELDANGHLKRSTLFNNTEGATIHDVNFKNIRISGSSNQGVITLQAKSKSAFRNITIDNVSLYGSESNVGTVAGYADDCSFDNIQVMNSDISDNDRKAGGIVGFSKNSVYNNCYMHRTTSVLAESQHVGGITGCSESDVIKNCSNYAIVCGKEYFPYVGGIVGLARSNTLIESCINAGAIVRMENLNIVLTKYKNGQFKQTTINHGGKSYTVQEFDDDAISNVYYGGEDGGGIAGGLSGRIINCVNFSPIYCPDKAGGIVGETFDETVIEGCTNYGYNPITRDKPIGTQKNENVASIAGDMLDALTINNCLALDGFGVKDEWKLNVFVGTTRMQPGRDKICTITNSLNTLGIFAEQGIQFDKLTITNCYNTTSSDVAPEMLTSGMLAYWLNNGKENRENGTMPWRQNLGPDGDAMPTLDPTHAEPSLENLTASYVITTPDELMRYAYKVNTENNYLSASLGCDITLPIGGQYTWNPIGSTNRPFQGLFNGNGHTINNLHLSSSYMDKDDVGLFGVVGVQTEIRNVILGDRSSIITNGNGAAGIVGAVRAEKQTGTVIISGCGNEANIKAAYNAAGIVGRVFKKDDNDIRLTIEDCYTTGRINSTTLTSATNTGESAYICGYTGVNATIRNCWATGELSSTAGGNAYLPNEYFVNIDNGSTVGNCYAIAINHPESVQQTGAYHFTEDQMLGDGMLTLMLNGNSNYPRNLRWQQDLGKDAHPVFGDKGVYHSRAITNKKYGTVCVPFPLSSDDKVKLYRLVSTDSDDAGVQLKFEYTEVLYPGAPALYIAMADDAEYNFRDNCEIISYDYDRLITVTAGDWKMQGTFTSEVFTGTDAQSIYYISNNLIRNATTANIAPYRAYFNGPNVNDLKNPATSSAKAISLIVEDENGETTTITQAELGSLSAERAGGESLYNIYGIPVNDSYRGVVIRGGKKFVK